MHTPFDEEWFASLLATQAGTPVKPPDGQARGCDATRLSRFIFRMNTERKTTMRRPSGRPRGGARAGKRAEDWREASDTIGLAGQRRRRDGQTKPGDWRGPRHRSSPSLQLISKAPAA